MNEEEYQHVLTLRPKEMCPDCKGDGGWDGDMTPMSSVTPWERCPRCKGMGKIDIAHGSQSEDFVINNRNTT